jgi:Leucine-rich repeat (LRR) protein
MSRSALLLFILFLPGFFSLLAQESSQLVPDPDLVKNSEQLNREVWFTSLEDAMREPEKVYKLNLKGQKLKQFPEEIFQLPNLHLLDLSDNKIKIIPDRINELVYLKSLNLTDNKIRFLPKNLQYLSQLTSLYLGSNKLIEVPAWVGGLGKLRRLDVSRNNLNNYEILSLEYQIPNCRVTH